MRYLSLLFVSIAVLIPDLLGAAELIPPSGLMVEEVPNDAGDQLKLTWTLSPDDPKFAEVYLNKDLPPEALAPKVAERETEIPVTGYKIERRDPKSEKFEAAGKVDAGIFEFIDTKLEHDQTYEYRVFAFAADDVSSPSSATATGVPLRQWIDKTKIYFGLFMLVVCGSVVYFIEMAKAGKTLKIRKIAGLEAIEEAVGRATEMGRDCLFVPGIQDIKEIQTVAGLIILNRVAQYTAEYDAGLDVPTARSLVMTTARETVEGAYLTAGRPDLYNPDNIYYLTDEQFGFVAAVTGKMVRDKPAACFYMGAFYAESLIFAETANTVGAIQIAGTAMPSQLPFFVAACDYVLIGEEFFAASAYLSGEPQQLGSLKGQDVGKLIGGLLILVTSLLMTFDALFTQFTSGLASDFNPLPGWVSFIRDSLLGS